MLGANGHTAHFVIDELDRRGFDVLAATRDGNLNSARHRALRCQPVDFSDARSLDAICSDADAVINCAGPFFDTALPAAQAAVRAGIPYLDVTAEQHTTKAVLDTLDGPATRAGVVVVPAMGFFGGLADLMASTIAQQVRSVRSVEIGVALDHWHPTKGTRLTGARNIFPRVHVADGSLTEVAPSGLHQKWDFGGDFGVQHVTPVQLSEIVLIHRHIRAQSIVSYMNEAPLDDLKNPDAPAPHKDGDGGRSAQNFALCVSVTDGSGVRRHVKAEGRDIYAVTAPLVVSACERILRGQIRINSGARAPGELFQAREFLFDLEPNIHVEYR
ncbi:saccharopine dehydrogenase NADP-binding domain-containing protein [Sphingomicrobium sp. XHP0239]|uniref:saccharopine dehydrogenase NADP-binding domain-containing protein n=1 Tax=Sphingomicrobium maritimum TaxID=3133972 RepID=UPI0031CC3954